MTSELSAKYLDFYKAKRLINAYPAEYLVRIFLGNYPRLSLNKTAFFNQRLLEVGCGDGRNLMLFSRLGLETYGTEIADEIAQIVSANLAEIGVKATIKTGWNIKLPYESGFFDYLVSWNSSYYMGDVEDYHPWEAYVDEFCRVIKHGGMLVLSIPKESCFIYQDSIELRPGYRKIVCDPYGIRNNHVFRCFSSADEIVGGLTPFFDNFRLGSIDDDCFGQMNRWHIIVCNRKN